MILSMPFLKPMPTPLAVDLDLAKTQVEAKIAAEGAANNVNVGLSNIAFSQVPEPSSTALGVLGIFALLARIRRFRRK